VKAIPSCSVMECERPAEKRGWCSTHYSRWRRTGTTEPRTCEKRLCSIEGCGKPAQARGWCSAHRSRWMRYGDPEHVRSASDLAFADGDARWNDALGYERRYQVSDDGRVRSLPRPGVAGGELKLYKTPGRYPTVNLSRDGSSRTEEVHRLVARAFLGEPPEGHEVRHLDGNPWNCTLENLAYGTRGENMRDKRRHGTDHNAIKTHCPAGHPYEGDNLRIGTDGGRDCLACFRSRSRHRAVIALGVPRWRFDASRRCRWLVGRRSCGKQSVAAIQRGSQRKSWWGYCQDHVGEMMPWIPEARIDA
jgi:hypothetical protein